MLKSPHFWVIIAISLVLIFIYLRWPWRVWQFESGVWQWFPWLSSLYNIALLEARADVICILFLIPILYATITFRLIGAFIFSILSVVSLFTVVGKFRINTNSLIMNIIYLLVPVTIILIIQIELELRRKDKESFVRERQIYTSKALEVQEKERQRIAQELHDETIQTLVAISKRAESILSSRNVEDVSWIRSTTLRTIDNLRRITLDLRPAILDDMGLISALRWLADRANSECNTYIQILVNGLERKLPIQTEIIIFRLVQEAINNIILHSKAKEAAITLEFGIESLNIRIQDDGQGFSVPTRLSSFASQGKLGLIGMQERIEALGGKYKIHSQPGSGTVLFIEMNC